MLILILGLALWWGAHLFKRFSPEKRAALGDKGPRMVAIALAISVLLMIWGYKVADGPVWWGRSAALVGLNNLLVLAGFYMFAASGMKTRATAVIRNPQLVGFSLWSLGHLVVNGDLASFILFGGLLAWAQVEILVLNRLPWTPPEGPFATRKEVMAAAGAIIVTVVVGLIHGIVGPWPFGG
ncbi:NnrU family protein [Paracoccus sp. Z330]|uniref:NnrU family protein n=1 Tax=Paracoccus onchidii TaxID=3017813 RepID=A0ABT4ZGU8_9RHOB|nr:NnrU family protein [Paracoccus onchidii]MDB6178489.1 NnrU family protein [Paracoccus onchidii]